MTKDDKQTKPSDIVAEAKKRFERAKQAYSSNRMLAVEDTRFAMGDSDNGWQWPEDIRNSRKIDKRVCLTVNMTAQHCNQIINNIRMNRPAVKVSPADNGADRQPAPAMTRTTRPPSTASTAARATGESSLSTNPTPASTR